MLSLHQWSMCNTCIGIVAIAGTSLTSIDTGADPIGIVALAGTSLTSSTYRSVRFILTFFNELSELNDTIVSIKAKVIDSCIEVIIGRPVIRSHHLTRKLPSYFDEVESRCQSNQKARSVSTPVCSACHSCAHPRCQQSHAKQMGIDDEI
jgi:hypothetical protein